MKLLLTVHVRGLSIQCHYSTKKFPSIPTPDGRKWRQLRPIVQTPYKKRTRRLCGRVLALSVADATAVVVSSDCATHTARVWTDGAGRSGGGGGADSLTENVPGWAVSPGPRRRRWRILADSRERSPPRITLPGTRPSCKPMRQPSGERRGSSHRRRPRCPFGVVRRPAPTRPWQLASSFHLS